MKKRRIIAAVAIVVVVGLVVGVWWYWRTAHGVEDLGRTVERIPKPVENPPPIEKGVADWPCWSGPGHDNRSAVVGIRTDWSGGLRKVWEVHYLCQGSSASTWAAPVVWGNRLVVPGRDADNDLVFCLDPATGTLLWYQSYKAKADALHGPGARATPFIDEDRVYTFGRSGDLVCWRLHDGKMVWRKNVRDDGGATPRWGCASSPLVHQDKVIVQAGGEAMTIAYDKMTGQVSWKSGPGVAGYAAIRPIALPQKKLLLVFHGMGLAGLDPADGRRVWDMPWQTKYQVNAATPVVDGNTVFITSDYDMGCELLRVSGDAATVLWRNRTIESHHSDPIIINGHAYGYSGTSSQNNGDFKCVAMSNGKEQWSTGEIGWGTTVHVDGHLLCMDIKGNLFLVKPRPDAFEKVTEFRAAVPDVGGHAWTIPVPANGKLYLRYRQTLICYDLLPPGGESG